MGVALEMVPRGTSVAPLFAVILNSIILRRLSTRFWDLCFIYKSINEIRHWFCVKTCTMLFSDMPDSSYLMYSSRKESQI